MTDTIVLQGQIACQGHRYQQFKVGSDTNFLVHVYLLLKNLIRTDFNVYMYSQHAVKYISAVG